MATFERTGPRSPVVTSTRVDKIRPLYRFSSTLRALIVASLAIVGLIPVFAMGVTAFKSRNAVVSVPPSLIPVTDGDERRIEANELWRETREGSLARHFFEPTLEGLVFLLTERAIAGPARGEELRELAQTGDLSVFDRVALNAGQEILGPRGAPPGTEVPIGYFP